MNTIHSTAIISPNALIGTGNVFGPYCVVHDSVEIGDNNVFASHVVIGSDPEHRVPAPSCGVVIGSNNVFREFITVNGGTKIMTRIGSHGYFMRGSHVGHDAVLGDWVTLACNAIVGGHSHLMDYANMGLGSIVHQNIVLPPGIMLGAGAVAVKAVYEEWTIYTGVPAKKLKKNDVGLSRANLSPERLSQLQSNYIQALVNLRMQKSS